MNMAETFGQKQNGSTANGEAASFDETLCEYEDSAKEEVVALSSVEQVMGAEIKRVLGEHPTPERFEAAAAMALAASQFLDQLRRASTWRVPWNTASENLERLHQVQGAIRDPEDETP